MNHFLILKISISQYISLCVSLYPFSLLVLAPCRTLTNNHSSHQNEAEGSQGCPEAHWEPRSSRSAGLWKNGSRAATGAGPSACAYHSFPALLCTSVVFCSPTLAESLFPHYFCARVAPQQSPHFYISCPVSSSTHHGQETGLWVLARLLGSESCGLTRPAHLAELTALGSSEWVRSRIGSSPLPH